jgi:hypothetical protein
LLALEQGVGSCLFFFVLGAEALVPHQQLAC